MQIASVIVSGLVAGWIVAGFAQQAIAFDCNKARTDVETEICANPDVKQSDDDMADAYFALRDRLDKKNRKQLLKTQKSWLHYRNTSCGAVGSCIESENRSHEQVLRNATNGLVPVFRWQQGGRKKMEIKFQAVKFAFPVDKGQMAFNREIARLIKKSGFGKRVGIEGTGNWTYEKLVEISLISGLMISASVDTYEFTGGAHPNGWSDGINIDRASGRFLRTGDLFAKASVKKLIRNCQEQIISGKATIYNEYDVDKMDQSISDLEENYPGEVKKHIGDLHEWRFEKDKAVVMFDPYEVDSYAAGPFECKFDYSYLKPMMSHSEYLSQ